MNTSGIRFGSIVCCGVLCVLLCGCGTTDPAAFDRAKADAAAENWNGVTARLPLFIEDHPDDARITDAYLLLGAGYEKLQRWDDALRTYELIRQTAPAAPAADSAAVRLRAVRSLAGRLKGEGDFQGAAAVFRGLLQVYPDDTLRSTWQVALGFCSELAGDWEEALRAYRGFLDRTPRGADADSVRATLAWLEPFSLMLLEDFRGAADYPAAIRALQQFREQHPDHPRAPDALFWIGYAHEYNLDAPDIAGALAAYEEFGQQYPGHPYAAQALYQTGHCYQNDLDNPQLEKAVTVFDRVVARFPGTEWAERALFAKADICERQLGRYRDAIDAYTAVLGPEYADESRFQKFLYARVRIGCIYKDRLKEYDKARQTFENILKIDPDGWYSGRVDWQLRLMDRNAGGGV